VNDSNLSQAVANLATADKIYVMLQLSPVECRVLGVLVEKATTTLDQYPLSINAAVIGANQKSNRDPVLELDERAVFDALESLRNKALAVRVESPGNRVHKYRHNATEVLHVRAGELAILAELLLRGPQTLGELRGRATRMSPLDSLETAKQMLDALMIRSEPLVRELPPEPGSRANRYQQLLCPDLHPLPGVDSVQMPVAPVAPVDTSLLDRIAKLETEVEALRKIVYRLAESLGESL